MTTELSTRLFCTLEYNNHDYNTINHVSMAFQDNPCALTGLPAPGSNFVAAQSTRTNVPFFPLMQSAQFMVSYSSSFIPCFQCTVHASAADETTQGSLYKRNLLSN